MASAKVFGEKYLFKPLTGRFPNFPQNGLGPFTIERDDMVNEIIGLANPTCSVHISGCRGAGKTTLLNQIGMKLLEDKKTVWHFVNAKNLSFESVYDDIARAVESGEELYILVDETQNNYDASAFTVLLKNTNPSSNVTTIGAGIASEPSSSYHFVERYQPESLLLLTDGSLEEYGVDEFFTSGCEGNNKQQMLLLFKHIRWYVGGHVYPLVWLAEKLKARILEGQSAVQVKKLLDSYDFRNEKSFKQMVERIVPTSYTDLRPLLHKTRDPNGMIDFKKKGICNSKNEIISFLLLEVLTSRMMVQGFSQVFRGQFSAGLAGVCELLAFALPSLDWSPYNATGGPTEDALSLELIVILNQVQILSHRLFNPKLVNAGTAHRRPDIFLNSMVNAYVECVLTRSLSDSAVRDVEDHIGRFLGDDPYYKIEDNRTWAVLHFQGVGDAPMQLKYLDKKGEKGQPMDPQKKKAMKLAFSSGQIFTFLMQTRDVYCGAKLIAGPNFQEAQSNDPTEEPDEMVL
ncbi:AAA domain containing protein [Nitzschia inconspicua]|uniref:AAA domain containing protein n=1 Tax=Nitzschia inconspicua TaxID=303405 RepID=A0A9K3L705_9STRA|nr:AAA domain containing protein [Nitzschia inconspicua]